MAKRRMTTALLVLAATAATAAGFDPDPEGQYDVMRGVRAHALPSQVALFDDMIDGADECAPQLYLDAREPGFLDVTVLAPCHSDAQITLLHYGTAYEVMLSAHGAAFARIDSATGAGRVTAAFQGGTLLMQDISAAPRSAALVTDAQDG